MVARLEIGRARRVLGWLVLLPLGLSALVVSCGRVPLALEDRESLSLNLCLPSGGGEDTGTSGDTAQVGPIVVLGTVVSPESAQAPCEIHSGETGLLIDDGNEISSLGITGIPTGALDVRPGDSVEVFYVSHRHGEESGGRLQVTDARGLVVLSTPWFEPDDPMQTGAVWRSRHMPCSRGCGGARWEDRFTVVRDDDGTEVAVREGESSEFTWNGTRYGITAGMNHHLPSDAVSQGDANWCADWNLNQDSALEQAVIWRLPKG